MLKGNDGGIGGDEIGANEQGTTVAPARERKARPRTSKKQHNALRQKIAEIYLQGLGLADAKDDKQLCATIWVLTCELLEAGKRHAVHTKVGIVQQLGLLFGLDFNQSTALEKAIRLEKKLGTQQRALGLIDVALNSATFYGKIDPTWLKSKKRPASSKCIVISSSVPLETIQAVGEVFKCGNDFSVKTDVATGKNAIDSRFLQENKGSIETFYALYQKGGRTFYADMPEMRAVMTSLRDSATRFLTTSPKWATPGDMRMAEACQRLDLTALAAQAVRVNQTRLAQWDTIKKQAQAQLAAAKAPAADAGEV